MKIALRLVCAQKASGVCTTFGRRISISKQIIVCLACTSSREIFKRATFLSGMRVMLITGMLFVAEWYQTFSIVEAKGTDDGDNYCLDDDNWVQHELQPV